MIVGTRRRIPPMPIEDKLDDPRAIALPPAGYAMLTRLCEHYWITGCRAFPMDDDTLFVIVRAHRPTWRGHKAVIMAIFADIRPRLERAWKARATSHATLKAWTQARDAKRRHMKATGRQSPAPVIALTPKHGQQRKERLAQGDSSFYKPQTQTKPDSDMFTDQ